MSQMTVPASPATVESEAVFVDKPVGPVKLIIRAVLLENMRRRDFYVVLILMGLYMVGALVARLAGVQNEATAGLLLNLGLTLASLSAHAIALLAAARQMPNEMEQRTIYPLLAKPIRREQLLLGKWAASWLSGVLTLLLLLPLALLPVGSAGETSTALFLETILLQIASLGALAALAILGSLIMPRALNIVIVGLLALAGGTVVNLLRARFTGTSADGLVRWVTGYVPDFSRLDLVLTYTSGGVALSLGDLAVRVMYALVLTAFPLALAGWILDRRSL